MSNRSVSQNGRHTEDNFPSTDDLLTQREYAAKIDVTPSYVSKRTKNGGLIDGTWSPSRDAVVDEAGNLLGYTDPTPRPGSEGGASQESARKAAGVSSNGSDDSAHRMGNRENDQARENPSGRTQSTGQPQSGGQSQGSGLEEAIERAGETAGRQVAKSPGALRGLVRLGGSAAGAILAAKLVGRGAGPVLLGTAIGFAITEYAIRAEETRPQKPTRQIRPKGLRQPLRYNLPPGMGQASSQLPMRNEAVVEKERLASSRTAGT
ncbi:hypothetical protein GGQ00_003010 [Salinibacter ruber]|uniref:hypothetical protein n=1 Tax=Salinibacter ruber TaxID=146919 RepID=UPI0021691E98|nr:hypothetical protein [Salinibacter ruber]MCS4044550.1 hypothetical protein [Salinibacter ruber]